MAERLPPLNAVRYFEAASRHLSFTKAAAELNVTHSAISHQIKALEDWLGVRLFRRLNRAVVLTEEGQAYVKPVREAFERLGEATRELRRREGAGVLTVSVMPSFAAKWLVPRLRGFRDAHPDVDVRISATEKLVEGYVAADNYWTARQMLRNLAELVPDHPVVAKWEGQFQQEAAALLAEGREAEQAGRLRDAHRAGRRLMHIWPDLPEGKQFIDSIQSQYPRVVVGVTLPAADAGEPGQLHDWAARRRSRLLCRTLTEFVGRTPEGGKYHCPVGEIEIGELGLV